MSTVRVKTLLQVDEKKIETVADRTYTDVDCIHDQCYTLTSETKTLWDAVALGAQTGFSLLVLASDQPLELELVTENALLERAVNALPVEKDVALVLGGEDALYDFTTDAFVGQVGKINRLKAREINGVEAKARLMLFR